MSPKFSRLMFQNLERDENFDALILKCLYKNRQITQWEILFDPFNLKAITQKNAVFNFECHQPFSLFFTEVNLRLTVSKTNVQSKCSFLGLTICPNTAVPFLSACPFYFELLCEEYYSKSMDRMYQVTMKSMNFSPYKRLRSDY